MQSSSAILLVSLGFISMFVGSEAVFECYQCNSYNESKCEENPPPQFVKPCPDDAVLCRKIDQWVDYNVGDMKAHYRVIRMCGVNQTNERASYYRAGFGGRQRVSTCHESKCNGSSGLAMSGAALVALFLTALPTTMLRRLA